MYVRGFDAWETDGSVISLLVGVSYVTAVHFDARSLASIMEFSYDDDACASVRESNMIFFFHTEAVDVGWEYDLLGSRKCVNIEGVNSGTSTCRIMCADPLSNILMMVVVAGY